MYDNIVKAASIIAIGLALFHGNNGAISAEILSRMPLDNRLKIEASEPRLNEENPASDSLLSRILNRMLDDFDNPDEVQWGMAHLTPEGHKLYYIHPVICESLCMKRKPEDLDYRLLQINHRRINDLGYLSDTLGIMVQYLYKGFLSMTLDPDRKNLSLSSDRDFEIGLEIGLRFYKQFLDAFSIYTEGSIGPMYTTRRFEDQATERGNLVMTPFTSLGFAFGNSKSTRITVSSYWRHFSKDGIYRGNNDGIDLNIWELGIIYRY